MRRVPDYLIIGNGRVARHMLHYLSLLNIEAEHWHRGQDYSALGDAKNILVLISDGAIESFIAEHLSDKKGLKIHFSGSLVTSLAIGAHPLMTFGPKLYDIEKYQKMYFVLDQDAPDFADVLPNLSNQHVRLEKKDKAKYHAMCVMAANYSCLLWNKLFDVFEREFDFPAETAFPLLQQQTENLLQDHQNALTGPLVRGDDQTILRNLEALNDDTYQDIYKIFVETYRKDRAC